MWEIGVRKSLFPIGFYKGLPLTIRFCSCPQGRDGVRSGLAEATFKKTKESPRFPRDAKGGSLDAHEEIDSRPGFQWRESHDFYMFIRVSG